MNNFDAAWILFLEILTERNRHTSFTVDSVKNSLNINYSVCLKIINKACDEAIISSVGIDEYRRLCY